MVAISIIKTKILIDNKPLTKYIAQQKAALSKSTSGNAVVRTVVLRYFSDFISQQGLLRETTAVGDFTKLSARPDIQGSLAAFKKTFGVDFAPTEVTGVRTEAFAELKQRTSQERAVTLTSIQLSGSRLANFTSAFKLAKETKESGDITFTGAPIKDLTTKELLAFINNDPALRTEIISTINQKFENFVVIDYLDKDRGAKPRVKVLTNAAKILNLTKIDSGSIDISARTVKGNIKLEFKLSDSAYKDFVNKAVDTTEAFHASLSKNVSVNFTKYAIKRFTSGKAKSDTTIFLQEVLSIAREFEKGSDTPITYETSFPKQTQGSSSLTVFFPEAKKKSTRQSPQSFISGAQWTVLTQRRLGETMLRLGEPEPPELKERTGRFRGSVQVFPNYRTRILQYTYNPLYRSLEKYGYRPDLQVETAIREVAQSLYAARFNIIRTASL
jgi:hypothetical protein